MLEQVLCENMAAALRYAAHYGIKVFPCNPKSKTPYKGSHSFNDATLDPGQIIRWWTEKPDSLIAMPTADRFVLDVDRKSGGLETLAKLEAKYGKLPLTPTVQTGSLGFHYHFVKPKGVAKIPLRAGLAPGLDVRSDGGYVILPPSLHPSGNAYVWIHGLDTPMAEPPAWFVELCTARTMKEAEAVAKRLLGEGEADGNAEAGLRRAKPSTATPSTETPLTLVWGESHDLATHPGEAAGKRNATLCQLVGIHLSRGDSVEKILALAKAWAKRCEQPCGEPFGDAQVEQAVIALHRKSEQKGEYRNCPAPLSPIAEAPAVDVAVDDGDEEAVPEPPTLSSKAYIGLLGEYVKAVEPHSEADPTAILLTALAYFGCIVGRKPTFIVEADAHHANLFLVCVGQSGHSRKGVSCGRASAIYDEEFCKINVISGLSSGEGIINAVRDAVSRFNATDGVMEVLDPGVEDKRRVIAETEFAQTLGVLRREGNTLSAILRNAWDGLPLRATTKVPQLATDAHVAIVAHITRQELQRRMSETEYFNGFANRFLWAHTRRSKMLPDGGGYVDTPLWRKRMAEAVAKAQGIGEMKRSAEAQALWREAYAGLCADRPGLWGAITGRAEAITLRLSMIYALADCSAVIEARHLEAALACWEFCSASARYIFGDEEPMGVLEAKVYAVVCEKPGISQKGLYDALQRNTPAKAIAGALASLRDKQRLYAVLDNSTGGRCARRWYAGQQPTPVRPYALTPEVGEQGLRALGRKGVAPAEALPPQPLKNCPAFSSAKAWAEAVHHAGGKIAKQEDGSCTLWLPPELEPSRCRALEADAQHWLGEACAEYLTEAEFTAELEAI